MERFKDDGDVAIIAVQTAFEGFGANRPENAKQTPGHDKPRIPAGHSGSENERSTVMERYRTGGTPWTVIIDRAGIVRYDDFQIEPEEGIALIERLLAGAKS